MNFIFLKISFFSRFYFIHYVSLFLLFMVGWRNLFFIYFFQLFFHFTIVKETVIKILWWNSLHVHHIANMLIVELIFGHILSLWIVLISWPYHFLISMCFECWNFVLIFFQWKKYFDKIKLLKVVKWKLRFWDIWISFFSSSQVVTFLSAKFLFWFEFFYWRKKNLKQKRFYSLKKCYILLVHSRFL